MVKIRLTRLGGTKKPFYRLIAIDSRKRRDGACLEQLGWYDPKTSPSTLKVELARVDYWLSQGAQTSETAASLIRRARKSAAEA